MFFVLCNWMVLAHVQLAILFLKYIYIYQGCRFAFDIGGDINQPPPPNFFFLFCHHLLTQIYSLGNRAVLDHSIFFSYYGSQWCPKTAWLQTLFKISSFVFSRTKKFIQVWNYLRVSKWWQNFHFFGWTIPLFTHHFILIWIELDPGWFLKNTLLLL